MNFLISFILAMLLVACVEQPARQSSAPLANNGQAVAAELTRRYNLTYTNCWNSETAPAFLCSGVVLRGTTYSDDYNVWDPSPVSVEEGGVSFSYMRQDARFPAVYPGANNGYIVMPSSATPATSLRFNYLCFYPIDGATRYRHDNGCGIHPDHPVRSRYCSAQGVRTAEQFYAHYLGGPYPYYQSQCSLDMRDTSPEATAALFREGVRAMRMLPANNGYEENELKVRTWSVQPAAKMPIEAFFYNNGSSDGKEQARKNQRSYFEKAGRVVPIISLKIDGNEYATFYYFAADQVYQ